MEDVMKEHIEKCYQITKKLFILHELYRSTRKSKGESFIQAAFLPMPVKDITDYLYKFEKEGALNVQWEEVKDTSLPTFNFTYWKVPFILDTFV